MKKYWHFLIPLAILALPLLLVVWYVVSFGYSWSEAFTSLRHFGECRTRYAQKFSESQLSRILPGMKGDQVYALIGNPMEGHIKDGKPAPVWRYSLPEGAAAYYHERAIVFNLEPGSPPTVKSVIRRLHQPGSSLPDPAP